MRGIFFFALLSAMYLPVNATNITETKHDVNNTFSVNSYDTGRKTLADTIDRVFKGQISKRAVDSIYVNVKQFGAVGDGKHDDIEAFERARDYVIAHPAILMIPVGNFFISRSFSLKNVVNGQYQFFAFHLMGVMPNKSASIQYISKITCGFKSGYGIGIQLGLGVLIENITIEGQYTFAETVTNANIGTLKFSDWAQPGITDSKTNPYAGISIDYDGNIHGGGGSSDITIQNCSIRKWMVGAAISPNGVTANAEMINFLDDCIGFVRVGFAIGQDQSKEIHIDRLKIWESTHTIIDGITYGAGTGGGSVLMNGGNIAGNVNQIININADRFNFTSYGLQAESLFRIGYVGRGAGTNFIVPRIDFLSGPGLPDPDYILGGDANFYGGMLRYYDGSSTHRLNFINTRSVFRDMTLNNIPLTIGLYGTGWPKPLMVNVNMYYGSYGDTLIKAPNLNLTVDRTKWVASFPGQAGKIGDYLLGVNRGCFDKTMQNPGCPTIQIGRISKIENGVTYLDCVGLNCFNAMAYDAFYIDRIK